MPQRPIEPADLKCIQFVGDPQISPDGSRILFAKSVFDEKLKRITQLWIAEADSGVSRQWTGGDSDGQGRWSHDGKWIAFISGREKPSAQIFLISSEGGEAKKLTSLPEGSIGEIRWSPDGKHIAFTFRETHTDWTQKAQKDRETNGGSTPPRVIDTAWYRLDGDGYFDNQRFAIYVVNVATGEHKKLYSACPLGFYSFDWSPNSKELAVTHTITKNPFAEKPNDQIFRIDLNGQAWKLEGLPAGEKGSVRWSPDGKTLAYLGDEGQEDPWGANNVKLYTVPADGGAPTCLTAKTDYCLSVYTLTDTGGETGGFLTWDPESKGIYVKIGWHGEQQIGYVPVAKGGIKLLTEGQHVIKPGSLDAKGKKLACCFGTASRLDEIAVLDLKGKQPEPRRVTGFNNEFHETVRTIEPEVTWVEAEDGNKVQVWTMLPVGYKVPNRYPAVLEVHGGPHAQYGWGFFHEFQVLAAAGYVVVYSNPRGSKGYGEKFCNAIRGDWGNKDWIDIQAVKHWMQHQPYIHPGQMGIMGGSYGGYMTNWAIGHTNEFKAAITDRCVSNMVSMAGSSDFPFGADQYFPGYAWGDLAAIEKLWAQSPLAYFDKVQTPTLIIHSEGDLRCNIEQGEQVFAALQVRGIPSRFVRYPASTSHGMSRTGPVDLRIHRIEQILEWWKRYL